MFLFIAYGSWELDISGLLMMLVLRLTSVAFCYEDGLREENKLE